MASPLIVPTTEKILVTGYPYGGRRTCRAEFSLEFKKAYGFRQVFRSEDPKRLKFNQPRYSVYKDLTLMQVDENNFVNYVSLEFNEISHLENTSRFIYSNFDKFSAEQIEYFAIKGLRVIHSEMTAKNIKIIPRGLNEIISVFCSISDTGKNHFDKVILK